MKKLIFGLISVFLVNVANAQYDPKALEILDAMSKKYKAITAFEANISYTLINDVEKLNEKFSGKITVKGTKFKLVLDGQEIINNGTTMWTYLPDIQEVNIDNYDPESEEINPAKIYDAYKKGFKYLYLEDKTVDGVLCHIIDLVPEKKDAQYFKIRMNIAKNDKSIQSWTMFDKSQNRYTYSIAKFTPNIKVEDSFFNFDVSKYPGIEVVDLR